MAYTVIMLLAVQYRQRSEQNSLAVRWLRDKREDARLLTTTDVRRGNRIRKIKKKPKRGK